MKTWTKALPLMLATACGGTDLQQQPGMAADPVPPPDGVYALHLDTSASHCNTPNTTLPMVGLASAGDLSLSHPLGCEATQQETRLGGYWLSGTCSPGAGVAWALQPGIGGTYSEGFELLLTSRAGGAWSIDWSWLPSSSGLGFAPDGSRVPARCDGEVITATPTTAIGS